MDTITFMKALRETREAWEAAFARIDEARMLLSEGEGTWSVKDLLVHMTWYEREMVTLMQHHIFVASDLWEMEEAARNDIIRQQGQDRSLHEVITTEQQTHSALVAAVQTLSDQDMTDPQQFPGMPEGWIPWHIFAGNSFAHAQEHLPALRHWMVQE